ncbi:hypothetical protein T08_14942 [Trichinella sp. T8]|nr:hypothetical protein T08_14942 [Trichinella sp. T8]
MYLSVDREDNVVGIGLVIFARVHNYRLDGSEHTPQKKAGIFDQQKKWVVLEIRNKFISVTENK